LFHPCWVSSLLNVCATAQDRPQDYHRALSAACSKEINGQCKGIPDGLGQLLTCLYEHQEPLASVRERRFGHNATSWEKMLANLVNARRECDRDSQQWCKETISGGGNLLSCFLRAQLVISPQCNSAWGRESMGG
jgi:Cysteine rich repeat